MQKITVRLGWYYEVDFHHDGFMLRQKIVVYFVHGLYAGSIWSGTILSGLRRPIILAFMDRCDFIWLMGLD